MNTSLWQTLWKTECQWASGLSSIEGEWLAKLNSRNTAQFDSFNEGISSGNEPVRLGSGNEFLYLVNDPACGDDVRAEYQVTKFALDSVKTTRNKWQTVEISSGDLYGKYAVNESKWRDVA